jgi:hypothetical protein
LTEILKIRRQEGKKTFACFIDISKAYDKVFRDGLWKQLWDFGIRGKMWRVVKALYKNTQSSMLIDGKKLDEFKVDVGVRQGCVLSPTLFSIFFDGLVKYLKSAGKGVPYYGLDSDAVDRDEVCCLFYADDIVLLAESDADLQALLTRVEWYSKRWRFKVSMSKTAAVVFGGDEDEEAALAQLLEHAGEEVEVRKAYKYLGMEVGSRLRGWATFKARMLDKATRVMRASWGLGLQSGHMSVAGGQKLWKAFVRPVLEYGAEVWETEADNKWAEAEAVQKEMGCKILRCSKKASADFVRGELGWQPLRARRIALRLRYWGALERMDQDRLASKVYRESRLRCEDGKTRNWCSYTRQLLHEVGLAEYWVPRDAPRPEVVEDAGAWRGIVGEAIAKWSEGKWRAEILRNGVLRRRYASIRKKRGAVAAAYLSHSDDPVGRKWWTRLRSGVANLRAHTGRFTKPAPTPFEERVCDHCSDWQGQLEGCVREPEDGEHLVMRCDKYRAERADMYVDLGWGPAGHVEGDTKVFDWLIGDGFPGEDKAAAAKRCAAVMRFLRRAWGKRANDSECDWAGRD